MLAELKDIGTALKKGFALLKRKEPLVLSSSTAFFATFSLSPIIIILVHIFSLYFKSERINHQFFKMVGTTFGSETAQEIETIVNNFRAIESNWWFTIAGLIFFLFVATTLLNVVKQSIQNIWHLRTKQKLRLRYYSKERGMQFAFLLFTGALVLISVFIDTRFAISLDVLQVSWPEPLIFLLRFLSILFSIIVVGTWFMILFKFLPESSVSWDIAFSGGMLTGLLFSAGKFMLGKILIHARVATIFGASASFALLLLFIFYSSFILYYGAAFTHAYSEIGDRHICAGKYTEEYEERAVENSQDLV